MTRTNLAAAVIALATVCAAPSASAAYGALVKVTVTDHTTGSVGAWTYRYSVLNSTACFMGNCSDTIFGQPIDSVLTVEKFSVPFFADGGIADILGPTGWSYAISDADTFGLGAGTLTWSALDAGATIAIGSELGGFQYNSAYAPGEGPFEAVLRNGESTTGDPAVPLSPLAVAAGLQPVATPSQVPEPQSMLLMVSGLGLLAATRAARRTK